MQLALIAALGVGGATLIGALIGFCFKSLPHRFNDAILSFAAGVMLCAAMVGLIIPATEQGNIFICAIGIFAGALFLNFLDRFAPHLHSLTGLDREAHRANRQSLDKVLLFVMAIAIHNFPEGMAAGVAFGSDSAAGGLTVAAGIALQNIPEGMIIISPLMLNGVTKKRTFFIALMTGLVEVVGTLFGYLAVSVVSAILPFMLAFAGGTMLYVISDEMIPETHSHGFERMATYALLLGFIVMLIIDHFIG